jgi:hypothetical protein
MTGGAATANRHPPVAGRHAKLVHGRTSRVRRRTVEGLCDYAFMVHATPATPGFFGFYNFITDTVHTTKFYTLHGHASAFALPLRLALAR